MYRCTSTLIKWTYTAASSRLIERRERERGGERRRRMLAIICIAPSRQVWVCEELYGCCYHWDTRSLSLFRLLLCIRVSKIDRREREEFIWNIPLCLVFYIREECFFFFGYQSLTIDEQSPFSPAVYVYDLLLFRDTFVFDLNF
jgi:hypothetical protein